MRKIYLLLPVVLSACSSEPDEDVLAKVNGETIREAHVEAMLSRFSDRSRSNADEEVRRNVLDSVVRARALAHVAKQSLSPEEIADINARADLHRDELLASRLLEERREEIVVSNEEIRRYYEENKSEFALGREVDVEYFQIAPAEDDAARKKALQAVAALSGDEGWKEQARRLGGENVKVTFHDVTLRASLLEPEIRSAVADMEAGEASGILYGKPAYRVRLLGTRDLGVKPLSEVSAKIRKRLLPEKIKKIVNEEAEDALDQSEVVYTRDRAE